MRTGVEYELKSGTPPSSVNCLVAAGFLPVENGADVMRVPSPAAGIITITFMAGLQVYEAGCFSSNRHGRGAAFARLGGRGRPPLRVFILDGILWQTAFTFKLPDGSVKDVPKGSTALDVAKSVGQRLADAALAAKTNGDLIDLTRPLEKDTDLRILTSAIRKRLKFIAFVCASAGGGGSGAFSRRPSSGTALLPKLVSSTIFIVPLLLTPEDLEKIEKKMQELVQQIFLTRVSFCPREQGLQEFKKEGDS